MIDIKNLSKIKYIYRVYKADNKFHCEKYPVIYMNKTEIYFKTGRKSDLSIILFDQLYENFEFSSGHFLNQPNLDEVNKNLPKLKLKNEIKSVETMLDSAKRNYEYYLNQYNSLMQDYEKLENKNNEKLD